jgi:hypothetical protein
MMKATQANMEAGMETDREREIRICQSEDLTRTETGSAERKDLVIEWRKS